MRTPLLALVGAAALWTSGTQAGEVLLFSEDYTPAELQALVVGPTSTTLLPGSLQIDAGSPSRTIAIEDDLTPAGAFAGFDFVRFDFTYDYVDRNEEAFGTTDKDSFVGIHDGARHFSIFNNETAALNVFGDTIVAPCTPGDLGIGGCAPGYAPSPPSTVRDVNLVPGFSASEYSASILMDSTGLATLSVLGIESSPMQLDFGGEYAFFFGRDASSESYRIESMSMRVTGINVPEPGVLGLLLFGGLAVGALGRRRSS